MYAIRSYYGLGEHALPVLTGARRVDGMSFEDCRALAGEKPLMIVFGTGWGLAPQMFEKGWPVLAPIRAGSTYNHLPVRSAVAIILDRLLAQEERS